jgi:hypothetical protein
LQRCHKRLQRRHAEHRRYLITITDAESREVVIFTGADWTAEERQIAVGTILRLAGLADDNYLGKAAEPRPKDGNA